MAKMTKGKVSKSLEKWCSDNGLIPRLQEGDEIMFIEENSEMKPAMQFVRANG